MYAKGVLQIRRRSRTNEPLSICPAQYIITVNAEEYASTPAPALHTCFPKLHREVCFNQSDRYSHIIGSQAQQHHSLLGPRYLCAWAAPPPTAERTYIRASQSSTELQCSTTRLHISVVIITTAAITSKFTIIGSPPVHHGDQPPSRSTRARSVSFCTQFGII